MFPIEVEVRTDSGNRPNFKYGAIMRTKGRKKRFSRIFNSGEEFFSFISNIEESFILFTRVIRYKRKFPRSRKIYVLKIKDD